MYNSFENEKNSKNIRYVQLNGKNKTYTILWYTPKNLHDNNHNIFKYVHLPFVGACKIAFIRGDIS